jgi:hypothetical protein
MATIHKVRALAGTAASCQGCSGATV